MKRVISALILGLSAVMMSAQITDVQCKDQKARQYDPVFFEITLTGNWDNPFLQEDAALDMLLTSPSGKELILPCFFKSGESGSASTWEARFTPQEKGTYSYVFRY